jgi:hypothetical protein
MRRTLGKTTSENEKVNPHYFVTRLSQQSSEMVRRAAPAWQGASEYNNNTALWGLPRNISAGWILILACQEKEAYGRPMPSELSR